MSSDTRAWQSWNWKQAGSGGVLLWAAFLACNGWIWGIRLPESEPESALGFLGFVGMIFALALGRMFASGGHEQFGFFLTRPISRGRFLRQRLVLGFLMVNVLLAIPLLTIFLDLPANLWGFVVDEGFPRYDEIAAHIATYPVVVVATFSYLNMCFLLAFGVTITRSVRARGLDAVLRLAIMVFALLGLVSPVLLSGGTLGEGPFNLFIAGTWIGGLGVLWLGRGVFLRGDVR